MTETLNATQEGNKLIAEFMEVRTKEGMPFKGGAISTLYDSTFFPKDYVPASSKLPVQTQLLWHWETELKYHSSWEWIMPVVEKILDETDDHTQQFAGLMIFELGLGSPKETVWKAVVEFIQWHNQNK